MNVPYFCPHLPPWKQVEPALRGIHESGMMTNGKWVETLEALAADVLGVPHVVACANATVGLMLAVAAVNEGREGETLLLPGFTFSATYQAAEWNGLTPLWVDCDADCNVNVNDVDDFLHRTWVDAVAAIVPVHVSGNPADVLGLAAVSAEHGVPVIYDAAHALGATYCGRPIATWGTASVFSLGVTKILTAGGEGGLVAVNDGALAERVRLAVNHGHPPGELDATVRGLNGRMTEAGAAYACLMFPYLDDIIARRAAIRETYRARLDGQRGITFPPQRAAACATWKDVSLFIDTDATDWDTEGLQEAMAERGVACKRYYEPPAHTLTILGGVTRNLPVTERLAARVLSLPSFHDITEDQINHVCQCLLALLAR